VVVPPTLQALLAARVDHLETAERSVLERGAIEGEIFHRGAVQALSPQETQVTSRLAALVRRELIRPTEPLFSGEDGFRFRHILIRDAAYDALPKATRADLHERMASWLEEEGTELVELDELIGYHLEQACRYRAELGTPDDGTLAAAARRRLVTGGHRAVRRQDYAAAASLLERAAALAPSDQLDLALENALGEALFWSGRSDEALRRADLLAERAAAMGDRVGEISARIKAGVFALNLTPEGATEELAASINRDLPELEAAGNHMALYIAYSALAEVAHLRARVDVALEASERAFAHAQAGHVPTENLGSLAAYRYFGSTPAPDLLEWLDENEPRGAQNQFLRAYRAMTLAMLGRADEGRAILAESRANQAERGGGVLLANLLSFECVDLELWAGDPTAAAEFGAEGFRLHEEMGNRDFLPFAAGNFARALYELDQLDEADSWAGRSAEIGTSDDALKEMHWRQVKAKVLARRGEQAEGERLAREAVAIGDGTDSLIGQGDAYADLAEVLFLGVKPDEAAAALRSALDRYERKGHIVLAQRIRERLAGFQ